MTIAIVLRFRDLNPPTPGNTIESHQKIVSAEGYVWWGWWKKQSEEFPLPLLGKLLKQAKGKVPLDAFLVDSGQKLLYKTEILDLSFNGDGEEMSAPEDGAKTPMYYNDSPLVNWFKLDNIERVNESELKKYTYLQVPHDNRMAVDEGHFIGHRVEGIDQLLEFGNVTYWVTEHVKENPDIARGPAKKKPLPPVATTEIVTAGTPRILHISDLHLSVKHHAFSLKGKADEHNKSLASAIYDALIETLPGVVVVTGDLTWSGTKSEFDLAFDCLDSIKSQLGLTRDQFIIIPGNHDLQWTSSPAAKDRYLARGEVQVTPGKAQKNYRAFFQKWYGTKANKWLSVGRRLFLHGGPTVDVLGLNSSQLEQIEDHFAGIGRVTESSFNETTESAGWKSSNDKSGRATMVRVLCLHHHVLPVISQEEPEAAKKGFGVALDAESLLVRATEHGVDLILHGHQHHPFLGFTHRERIVGEPLSSDQPILVAGAGSCGVNNEHLGPINQRCFNVLEFDYDGVVLEMYSTHSHKHKFDRTSKAKAKWGEPWQRQELIIE